METVTFEDMLLHYERKISEVCEDTEDIKTLSKEALEILERCWKGSASDAYSEKLREALANIRASDNELSEAMKKLDCVFSLTSENI